MISRRYGGTHATYFHLIHANVAARCGRWQIVPDPSNMQPAMRFVIFHRPGPAWQHGVTALEQPGVAAHFEYLHAAFQAGKIQMAGPFPAGSSGGMIILQPAATADDAEALVQGDPGVKSGLILAEVRPWLITLA